jgi:hypothetical protein
MLAGHVSIQGAPHVPVVICSVQESSDPPSIAVSSDIVIVQVPFGFSPMNAASGSSGVSGVAVTRLTYE